MTSEVEEAALNALISEAERLRKMVMDVEESTAEIQGTLNTLREIIQSANRGNDLIITVRAVGVEALTIRGTLKGSFQDIAPPIFSFLAKKYAGKLSGAKSYVEEFKTMEDHDDE